MKKFQNLISNCLIPSEPEGRSCEFSVKVTKKIRLKDIPKNLDLGTSLDLGTADADTEAVL